MTRLLVTGATGFLGSEIVRQAVAKGFDVVALKRSTSKTSLLDGVKVTWVTADVTDRGSLDAAFQGVDYCIHTAGDTSYHLKDRAKLERVNVGGTQNVLDAALKAKVKKFVHTSSVAAIGFDPSGKPVDESLGYNWPKNLPYMETKRKGENLVRAAVEKGLDAVIVNPATIFGPGNLNASEEQTIREVETGKVPGIPPGGMTVCDLSDVANGHLLALEKGRTGERYILGGHHVSHEQLMKAIAQELGVPFKAKPLPGWLLRIAGEALQYVEPYGIDIGTPAAFVRLSPYGVYHSSAKAEKELGYSPRPLQETLHRTIEYRKSKAKG